MKRLIYHAISLAVVAGCAILMPQYIHITTISLVPVAMILLTVLQVLLFKDGQQEEGFSTTYGADTNAQEHNTWTQYMRSSLMLSLPWQCIFVLFFPDAVKFLSCLWYVIFFVGGSVAFRIKYGKKIGDRHRAQRDELEEQRKKEEMGKWK